VIETTYPRLTAVLTKTDSISSIRKLGRRGSARAKQRAACLYIAGLGGGYVTKRTLERACIYLGCYNAANFTQNMKKDAGRGLWDIDERTYERGPRGWRLTEKGTALARIVTDTIDAGWSRLQDSISKTLVLTVSRCVCSYCGDDVTDDDKASCSGCKLSVHASCWSELKRRDDCCIAMGCRSNLRIVAIPTEFTVERTTVQRCYSCKSTGTKTVARSADVVGCTGCYGTGCQEHPCSFEEVHCEHCEQGRALAAAVEAAATAATVESEPVAAATPRTGGLVIRIRAVGAVDATLPADLGDDV